MKLSKKILGGWLLAAAAAGAAFFGLRADNARLRGEVRQAAHAAALKTRTDEAENILRAGRAANKEDTDWRYAWRKFCAKTPADLAPELLAKAAQGAPPADRGWTQQVLLSRWAETNGLAAISYARAHVDADAVRRVLGDWAAVDAANATAWVRAQPESPARDEQLVEALFWLAQKDPQAALAAVPDISVKTDRDDPFTTPHTQEAAVEQIFYQWAIHDGMAAVTTALAMPKGWKREGAMCGIANSGGGSDPAEVLASANAVLDQPEYFDDAIGVIVCIQRRWALDDPEAALRLVEQMPEGKAKSANRLQVLEEVTEQDPARALECVQGLPEGEEKSQYLHEVLGKWATQDPAATGEYIKAMTAGKEQDAAVQAYVESRAQADPVEAGNWALAFPEGQRRQKALESVMGSWMGLADPGRPAYLDDPGDRMEDAAKWVAELPEGPAREATTVDFVDRASGEFPMVAAPLAVSLSDAEARNKAVEQVAKSWLKLNRAEAEAWLAGTDLPEERKAKLLAGK